MIGVENVAKIDNLIVSTLKDSSEGLTLSEIAEKLGETEKKVYKSIRKLFEEGKLSSINRRYKLSKA